LAAIFLWSCGDANNKPTPNPNSSVSQPSVTIPVFDAENAYKLVEKQVSFGPRVPKTPAHEACLQWLKTELETAGAQVEIQQGIMESHLDPRMPIKNIIAKINPTATKRVLLCAHWDTRYIADQEKDAKLSKEPILGADDGGSGVAVLLEIAHTIKKTPINNLGVDIVLFDVEDQGEPQGGLDFKKIQTWCLGSQYWAKNKGNYNANFGILLDMVGSAGATFPKEGGSMRYAGPFVEKIWAEATNLGYSDMFVQGETKEIIDDHVFVNQFANIPTLDIINLPVGNPNLTFGSHWHTQNDNMKVIDKNTLKAVGQVLLNVLYKEAAGTF